jgi:hypothetical protein
MTDQPGTPGDADAATPPVHVDLHVERGNPTAEELAALIAVLSSASGGVAEPGVQERNLWGHPVEKLRMESFSWQRLTLLERTYMRR